MEMQEITIEGERPDEDARSSVPILGTKTKEEAELDDYSKLQTPSEDVYSEAYYGEAPEKNKAAGKPTEGNARLYRALCVFLTIICLVLLLVVIILCVKLQAGSTVCPENEVSAAEGRTTYFASNCSYPQCQAFYPNTQPHKRSCMQCADGWLPLGQSCFFLSTFRLSWDESQRNCSMRGGSLAVISSPGVQRFLSKEGKLNYWIGLRQNSDAWTWVNNTVLEQSYWADGALAGDCAILRGKNPPEKNWIRASCQAYTYFICQLQL